MILDTKLELSQYELLLLTFVGSIMAQTGCSREKAVERVAYLMTVTQQELGVTVKP